MNCDLNENKIMADELWRKCAEWLIRCQVIPADHKVTWPHAQVIDLVSTLRDGVLLCHLLDNLVAGCIDLKEINHRPQLSQFLCQKNIRTFLQVCQNTFDLKSTDLFEPSMLFDCTDFVRVLHTLSKLSNSPAAQQKGIQGFSSQSRSNVHDYYNDDIYRNLEDLANGCDDFINYEEVYPEVQVPDEGIYEDLCSFRGKPTQSPLFLEPPVEKRDYCIKELVETEKNYIDALNMIIRHFMRPLKSVLPSESKKKIFMNIKELSTIHSGFHEELVKACTHTGTIRISDCFLNWKDKFITYGNYCSNLPQAQELIDDLCSKNDQIDQLVNQCQMDANEGKFKLRDLLSVPMQRVLKYHLLLKELIRNTNNTHEDYPGLERALDSMLDLAQYINEVKRDNETLQIIRDIQESITDLDMPENMELKDYGRLLKDGELKIRCHNDSYRLRSRYVFVFDRVMLMCKSARGEQYSYKEALALSDFLIEGNTTPRPPSRDKWSFHWYLVHFQHKMVYTMYAKTEDMKRKWIEAISKALDNINPPESRQSDHKFQLSTFEKPTSCDNCQKLLKGAFFQGYRCETCKIGVHRECMIAVRSCGAPSLPPRPGENRLPGPVDRPSNNTVRRHPISCCIAKQSYTPSHSGSLGFQENDVIHILRKLSPTLWEGRSERTNLEGLFPSEYVEERPIKRGSYEVPPSIPVLNSVKASAQCCAQQQQNYVNLNLDEFPWYAGKMDKDSATTQLESSPNGTYMVRISERQNGLYAISIKHDNKVKHMRVQTDSKTPGQHLYYLSGSKYFKSIVELVKWYQENSLEDCFSGLNTTLSRPFTETTHGVVPVGYALVNYDFSGTAPNMLSLRRGERVAILCKQGSDKGWWKGRIKDKVGFFPMLYVTEVAKD